MSCNINLLSLVTTLILSLSLQYALMK